MIYRKTIFLDIFFTVLTGGLFNIWVQYRQIRDSNTLLPESEQNSFFLLVLFSILTLGIYFIWHEYKLTHELHLKVYGKPEPTLEFLSALGTFFGLWFIVDSYQQSLLNEYINQRFRASEA